MHIPTLIAALSAASVTLASRFRMSPAPWRREADSYHDLPRDVQASPEPLWPRTIESFERRKVKGVRHEANPFEGKKLTANPSYSTKLETVYNFFQEEGDDTNAAKVRTIQDIGSFFWVSQISSLPDIDDAISAARLAKNSTGEDQVVGLVVYNLPDRDCSGGESSGELESEKGGLEKYKSEYITPYAQKLASASDLTFAVVVEPDAIGNIVTNMDIEFCAQAAPVYEEGISYAIASLQSPNVNLYLDASHGGWLGWDDDLEPAAQEFAKVVDMAKAQSNNSTKIRGFSTNVSNYNPFHAASIPSYAEGSKSYDESSYAKSLSPHLEAAGLPSKFIVDQGRVALPGARKEWGEWCNVAPSGYGQPPGSAVSNNTHVDSIVWVKPGGESDGKCGYDGAPPAGDWFPEYVAMLVKNASPLIMA